MLNQAVLVGRIVAEPEMRDTDKGKVANIRIAVPRSFKNEEGEYDTDYFNCVLWKGVAESTVEYCRKGDLVGIKGRLQESVREDENGNKHYNVNVVAEKVTFLQSKRKDAPEPER